MESKDLSTMVGELGRMAKFYAIFESAHKAAILLRDNRKQFDELDAQITARKEQAAQLEVRVQEVTGQVTEVQAKLAAAEKIYANEITTREDRILELQRAINAQEEQHASLQSALQLAVSKVQALAPAVESVSVDDAAGEQPRSNGAVNAG